METAYMLAYLLIFLSANMGKEVDTHRLALEACLKDFPQGKVELNEPLLVYNPRTGSNAVTPFVWRCMRPIKKA